MKKATTVKQLPAVLGGAPVGTTFEIKGYVDSAGLKKDLEVETLGPDDYAEMKLESLKILQDTPAPSVPGFPPALVAQARDALMKSFAIAPGDNARNFKDPYDEAPEGGYSLKEGEDSVYLLRLRNVADKPTDQRDTRVDLVRAKAALVRVLDLPSGRYMHTVKLTDGKFDSVQKV